MRTGLSWDAQIKEIVTKAMVITSGKGDNLTNDCCDCDLVYFLVYEVTKL